jgi:hypothetical protein
MTRSNTLLRIIAACLFVVATGAPYSHARVEPQSDDEEPILPKKSEQVTIVHDHDRVLHIYQANGKVYGIKVYPKNGTAYFLVDMKGDGKFIKNPGDRMMMPEWVILSW